MVQMKIPAETKAIDKYLLIEYLHEENAGQERTIRQHMDGKAVRFQRTREIPLLQDDNTQDHVSDEGPL